MGAQWTCERCKSPASTRPPPNRPKRLDRQHHSSDDGPVLAALRGYPPVRGLVGAYGEASADVHALLKLTAAKKAETAFKEMGSRTPIEAEATLILSLGGATVTQAGV